MATAWTTKDASSSRFVTPLFMESSLNPINCSLIATALVPIAAAFRVAPQIHQRIAHDVVDIGAMVGHGVGRNDDAVVALDRLHQGRHHHRTGAEADEHVHRA